MLSKTAIITGGASGIGLAVAKELLSQKHWTVHLIDCNREIGQRAADSLGSKASFHYADVSSYESLSLAFCSAFKALEGRLDFVFANAGIVERWNFYAKHIMPDSEMMLVPPCPDLGVVDVNFKGSIYASYLALHFFRKQRLQSANLIITASSLSFYSSPQTPLYCSTKYGILGFMRSIARDFKSEGIRVNAICPGSVKTGILSEDEFKQFPNFIDIAINEVVKAVTDLEEGQAMVDSAGTEVTSQNLYGKAIEISRGSFYFRPQPEFCDDAMADMMAVTEATTILDQVPKELVSH